MTPRRRIPAKSTRIHESGEVDDLDQWRWDQMVTNAYAIADVRQQKLDVSSFR